MNYQTIVCCVVALLLGMLLFHMLKGVCGCKLTEGHEIRDATAQHADIPHTHDSKDPDIYRFARGDLFRYYGYLAEVRPDSCHNQHKRHRRGEGPEPSESCQIGNMAESHINCLLQPDFEELDANRLYTQEYSAILPEGGEMPSSTICEVPQMVASGVLEDFNADEVRDNNDRAAGDATPSGGTMQNPVGWNPGIAGVPPFALAMLIRKAKYMIGPPFCDTSPECFNASGSKHPPNFSGDAGNFSVCCSPNQVMEAAENQGLNFTNPEGDEYFGPENVESTNYWNTFQYECTPSPGWPSNCENDPGQQCDVEPITCLPRTQGRLSRYTQELLGRLSAHIAVCCSDIPPDACTREFQLRCAKQFIQYHSNYHHGSHGN